MMEMLVVIGVIALLCAIAVPSIIAIQRSLKLKQHNDYAELLFMAAQTNLTELYSDGGLEPLQNAADAKKIDTALQVQTHFNAEDWSEQYRYAVSGTTAYDMVIPPNSIDEAVRGQKVIVEYNPYSGNVYSVFYCEEPTFNLLDYYINPDSTGLIRKGGRLGKAFIGYYQGSGLTREDATTRKPNTTIDFKNDEAGIVCITVGYPETLKNPSPDDKREFMNKLKMDLKISGVMTKDLCGNSTDENAYSYTIHLKAKDEPSNPAKGKLWRPGTNGVEIFYVLDSLRDSQSFANHAYVLETAAEKNGIFTVKNGVTESKLLSDLTDDSFYKIYPGDNILMEAVAEVEGEKRPRPGVSYITNPMFEGLIPSNQNPGMYILRISNGRNLQNLNAIHPEIAKKISSVQIVDDINWDTTKDYLGYQIDRETLFTGQGYNDIGSPRNPSNDRRLPYFVPIRNDALFGSAVFNYSQAVLEGDAPSGTQLVTKGRETGVEILGMHQDYVDKKEGVDTPLVKIQNLNINQELAGNGNFTGLFCYVNGLVDNLALEDPKVKGFRGDVTADLPATGSLAGAVGPKGLITNCSAYLTETNALSNDKTAFTVTGDGAVGGLVGYAVGSKPVSTGFLKDSLDNVTFFRSFAALPVSGRLSSKHDGFSEGIGGFVGNSQMANAIHCYGSGDVKVENNTYIKERPVEKDDIGDEPTAAKIQEVLGAHVMLPYFGEVSVGGGGFAGTSHGTRYKNCFATGHITAAGAEIVSANNLPARQSGYTNYVEDSAGVGSFVGVMCFESQNNNQWTLMESCYAFGDAKVNTITENGVPKLLRTFAGCSARDHLHIANLKWENNNGVMKMYPGDYYRLLGPYYDAKNERPDANLNNVAGGPKCIFKDCYYMMDEGVQIDSSSNECATFVDYKKLQTVFKTHTIYDRFDTLKKAINKGGNEWDKFAWDYLNNVIGSYSCDKNGKTTYKDAYFDEIIPGKYVYSISSGFMLNGENWHRDFTNLECHPYSEELYRLVEEGDRYPFGKLPFMDYYGNWPTAPADTVLGYYERYADGTNGIYLDIDGAANHALQYNHGVGAEEKRPVAKEDGYAIFSLQEVSKIDITVEGVKLKNPARILKDDNGKAITYQPKGKYGSRTYYVYTLDMQDLIQNMDQNNFYTELKAGTKTESYVFYFNPKTAVSQLNPIGEQKEVSNPGNDLPYQIRIRSARQFWNVGGMDQFWGRDCNYIQELDVVGKDLLDPNNTYDWKKVGLPVTKTTKPIGNDDTYFQGTYKGLNMTRIRGFVPDSDVKNLGFFGTIGSYGKVEKIEASLSFEKSELAEAKKVSNLGIMVGANAGTLQDVHVVIHAIPDAQKSMLRLAADRPTPYDDAGIDWNDKDVDVHNFEDIEEILKDPEALKICPDLENKFLARFPRPWKHNLEKMEDYLEVLLGFEEEDIENGESETKLYAIDSAGGLVGISSGAVVNCSVKTDAGASLEITSKYSGGLVGSIRADAVANPGKSYSSAEPVADAMSVIGSDVVINDNFETESEFTGGLVGYADSARIMASHVELKEMSAENDNGGILGGGITASVKNSVISAVTAEIKKELRCDGRFGGIAGDAVGTAITGANVVLGDSEAYELAGLIEDAKKTQIVDSNVAFYDNAFGLRSAAGAFGTVDAESRAENTSVNLVAGNGKYGSIESQKVAAGFAVLTQGNIMDANVKLHHDIVTLKSDNSKYSASEIAHKVIFVSEAEDDEDSKGRPAVTSAAGFAATVEGGKIVNANVSGIGVINTISQKGIPGYAAGFACEIKNSATVTNAFITPVPAKNQTEKELRADYLKYMQDYLKVDGAGKASGFANMLEAGSTVSKSYTLCSIANGKSAAANTAGFVVSNAGTIDRCMANIEIHKGYAFAKNVDKGSVTNCYGWYTDGDVAPQGGKKIGATVPQAGEGYLSCYFADLDCENQKIMQGDKNLAENAILFDHKGGREAMSTTKLLIHRNKKDGLKPLDKLNGPKVEGQDPVWSTGTEVNFPFNPELDGETYGYPRLGWHYGDWILPPPPNYGIVYYECYPNDIYWVHLKDVKSLDSSDPDRLEDHSLDYMGYYHKNEEGKIVPIPAGENMGKPIIKLMKDKDGNPMLDSEGNRIEVVVAEILENDLLVEEKSADGKITKRKKTEAEKTPETPLSQLGISISKDLDIGEAGYAAFCGNLVKQGKYVPEKNPFNPKTIIQGVNADGTGMPDLNNKISALQIPGALGKYYFYNINSKLKGEIKLYAKNDPDHKNDPIFTFNNYFADTLIKDDNLAYDYQIRTAEQFDNLKYGETSDKGGSIISDFKQTWDILDQDKKHETFQTVPPFNGTYDGNDRTVVVENGSASWFEDIPTYQTDWPASSDNAKREVIGGNLNIEVRNTVSVPVIADGVNQKVVLNSLTIGNVNMNPKNPFAIVRNASGGLRINDKIHIRGDLRGSMMQNISGDGIQVGGIIVGGRVYNDMAGGNDFGAIFSEETCETGARIQIGYMEIAQLDHKLLTNRLHSHIFIDIDKIVLGEVSQKGYIAENNVCPINTPYIVVKPLPMHDTLGNPVKDENGNAIMTSGKMEHSLFGGNISSITLNTIDVEKGACLMAPVIENLTGTLDKPYTGITMHVSKAVLDGSAVPTGVFSKSITTCKVTDGTFIVDELVATGKVGVITGMNNGGDISNNTIIVNGKNVNLAVPSAMKAMAAQPVVFGAVAAENAGLISGNKIVDMNLTMMGASNCDITVGGVVGINKGTISENAVENAQVTYVQSAAPNDNVTIGGVVGISESGSIENINNVTGKITFKGADGSNADTDLAGAEKPTAMSWFDKPMLLSTADAPKQEQTAAAPAQNRKYHIGGIVGRESENCDAVYKNVTSSMEIDAGWAIPKQAKTAADPAGQGSVGMFIGKVTNGTFENCSSNVKSNSLYDFLGEISTDSIKTEANGLSSDVKKKDETLIGSQKEVTGDFDNAGNVKFNQYHAAFENCTFIRNGAAYKQVIESGSHYYAQDGITALKEYKLGDSPKVTVNKLSRMDLITLADSETDDFVATSLFTLQNGEYLPMYVKRTLEEVKQDANQNPADNGVAAISADASVSNVYMYQLAYKDPASGKLVVFDHMQTTDPDADVWNGNNGTKAFYTVSVNLENVACVILDESGEKLLSGAPDIGEDATAWVDTSESLKRAVPGMLWTLEENDILHVRVKNQMNGNYLDSNLKLGDEKATIRLRIFEDGSIFLGEAVKLNVRNVIVVENAKVFMNTFHYLGTAQVLGSVPVGSDEELTAPTEQTTVSEPAETTIPTEGTVPTEASKPTEAPKPTEEVKPTEAPKPTEEVKPTEAPKPTEAAKPTEAPKPTETLTPTEAPKSAVKPADVKPEPTTEPTTSNEGLADGESPREDVQVMD